MLEQVESAQHKFDKDELAKQKPRLRQGEFTLGDFKKLIGQTKRLGLVNEILGTLPGMGRVSQTLAQSDADKEMRRLAGIIDAMTPDERGNPKDVIDDSRRRRVAKGAGVMPSDVSTLVKQFEPMADLMKKISSMGLRDRLKKLRRDEEDNM